MMLQPIKRPTRRGRGARRRDILAGGLSLAAVGRSGTVRAAEAFPSRPLRIVVGFTPGGSSDIGARLLAERLAPRLGQPVVVENKPGAGGQLATTGVLREPTDGHALLFLASAHSVSAAMRASLPFDPVEDLDWISTVATYGMVLGVRPDAPYRSLAAFVAAAKAQPRRLSYYSVGHGTAHHLIGEWLNAATGAEVNHVPYRGSANALADFLSGRVDLMIDTMTFAYPQVLGGAVRPLAVTARAVPPELAGVPFAGDAVPGLEYESWLGVALRKGTPAGVVERLRAEVTAIVRTEDFFGRMRELGANAVPCTPAEYKGRVAREIAEFRRVVDARGIARE